jgi:hypothetical protein
MERCGRKSRRYHSCRREVDRWMGTSDHPYDSQEVQSGADLMLGSQTNFSMARSSTRSVRQRFVIESWPRHYYAVRPHQLLDYRPPALEVFVPRSAAWPLSQATHAPSSTQHLAEGSSLN